MLWINLHKDKIGFPIWNFREGRDKRINSHDDYRCQKRCYLGKSNVIWEYNPNGNNSTFLKGTTEKWVGHAVSVNKKKEIANIHVMYTEQKTALTEEVGYSSIIWEILK